MSSKGATRVVRKSASQLEGRHEGKYQNPWGQGRGAHLMLQTRTRVLDGTLRAKFQSWYPGLFHAQTADRSEHDHAA